jgi:hypothetical protein
VDSTLGASRISTGMTVVLIYALGSLAVSSWLPICGELLWVDFFITINTMFAYLSLIESMVVVWLNDKRCHYLLPPPFSTWVDWLILSRQARENANVRGARHADDDLFCFESFAGAEFRERFLPVPPQPPSRNSSLPNPEPPPTPFCAGDGRANNGASGTAGSTEGTDTDMHVLAKPGGAVAAPNRSAEMAEMADRLVFYESLFFIVDSAGCGWIPSNDVARMMAFFEMSFDAKAASSYLKKLDVDEDDDGGFTRREFVHVCASTLHKVPLDRLSSATSNYEKARKQDANYHHLRWKLVGTHIDQAASFGFPALYFFAVTILMNADFTDRYSQPGVLLYQGLPDGSVALPANRVVNCIAVAVVLGAIFAFRMYLGLRSTGSVVEKTLKAIAKEPVVRKRHDSILRERSMKAAAANVSLLSKTMARFSSAPRGSRGSDADGGRPRGAPTSLSSTLTC